jgi:hypothetical protein
MSTSQELNQALKALAETMNKLPNIDGEIIIPSATIIAIAALAEAIGAILKHLADEASLS